MRYLFSKAWKRFRANRKKYLLFILQISIGVWLVATSLTINFAFQEEFAAFKQKTDNLYININAGEIYGNSPNALSIKAYKQIQSDFKAEKDRLAYYKTYDVDGIPILFVDENFYPLIMKAKNYKEGDAYIGSRARQYFDDIKSQGAVINNFMDTEQETVFGVPLSSMVPLKELEHQSKCLLEDGALTDINGEVDFEDYIIFPLAIYENLETQPDCFKNLAVITDSEDNAEKLAANILENLRQKNENENYMVMNYAAFAEESMNQNVHIAALLNFLAGFVLIIVVFGFMGLLFILISQRSKEFAISLMCGAIHRQISLELFMEILLVIIIGVCVGNLLSALLLPVLGNHAPTLLAGQVKTLLITLLGGVVVSGLVCLPLLYKLKHITPVKLLKNL